MSYDQEEVNRVTNEVLQSFEAKIEKITTNAIINTIDNIDIEGLLIKKATVKLQQLVRDSISQVNEEIDINQEHTKIFKEIFELFREGVFSDGPVLTELKRLNRNLEVKVD